jgi:hypothetical protein
VEAGGVTGVIDPTAPSTTHRAVIGVRRVDFVIAGRVAFC